MSKIFYVTGAPRTGSTVLMQILGQNPGHYVTPTSGLIDYYVNSFRGWRQNQAFQAEGLTKVKYRVRGAMRGVLDGWFDTELEAGKVCFDKNRNWLHHYEDVKWCMQEEPKMIAMVRDIREVLASMERLYQDREGAYPYPVGEHYHMCQTVRGRCQYLMAPDGLVGSATLRIRDALHRKLAGVLFLPYRVLVNQPVATMQKVHEFLELDTYDYDFDNIKQITHEDDTYHGMNNLHVVKPTLTPAKKGTWKKYLGSDPEYVEALEKEFADFLDGATLLPDVPIAEIESAQKAKANPNGHSPIFDTEEDKDVDNYEPGSRTATSPLGQRQASATISGLNYGTNK